MKWALLGVTVLWATSGCQRDPAARTEYPDPRPAAAPEVVAVDTAASQPLTRRDWHRLRRRTDARAPLVRYRAVRRPASLAAAPRETRLFDLTLKASEFFRIDPTQAAEVRGREGTVLRLPANALVDQQQRPVQEPVWLELKECYSLAELLLSDCVSRGAGGEALQARGMLLVQARTAKGQILRLATGNALALGLPPGLRGGVRLYGSSDRQRWAALPEVTLDPEPAGLAYAQAGASTGGPLLASMDSSAAPRPEPVAAQSETEGLIYSAELGWLTCMRPWSPVAEAPLLVPAEGADEHTTVRLVLPETNVILAGSPEAGGYAFAGVPAQQRAVLVGLRYMGGNAYVATQPLLTGTDTPAPLHFREVTLGELEQQMERLR